MFGFCSGLLCVQDAVSMFVKLGSFLDVLMDKEGDDFVLAKAHKLVQAEQSQQRLVGCCLLSKTSQAVREMSSVQLAHFVYVPVLFDLCPLPVTGSVTADEAAAALIMPRMQLTPTKTDMSALQVSNGNCAWIADQLFDQARSPATAQHFMQCFVSTAPNTFLKTWTLPQAFSSLKETSPGAQVQAIDMLTAGKSATVLVCELSYTAMFLMQLQNLLLTTMLILCAVLLVPRLPWDQAEQILHKLERFLVLDRKQDSWLSVSALTLCVMRNILTMLQVVSMVCLTAPPAAFTQLVDVKV